jgi:hypothetical protein
MGVDDLVPLLEITDKLDVLLETGLCRFFFFF